MLKARDNKKKGAARVKKAAAHPAPRESPGPDTAPRFPVVGVGASAGGLEALSALLRGLPAKAELAVVVVQHLARGHKSLLPELLQRSSALEVVEATQGMAIEPGHVYVIPPDTRMTVIDGKLALEPRSPLPGPDVAVDRLFRSMAEQYQEKAIGVVLSGGANDGEAGIREIKAAGGITFAQDPEEARTSSMPQAAIATGAVDVILPVARIAEELVRLAGHPGLAERREVLSAEPTAPQHDQLRRLFQLLRRSSGVDFTLYKSPTLLRRLQRRMALQRLTSLEAYLEYVQEHPGELENLYEDILIHVTSFFREPESFDVLKERVFPALIAPEATESPVRLWVPGCSSGEEVYSLAIALHELLGDRTEYVPVQIFGTDVSQRMIDRARVGYYSEAVAADVGPERLRRFFIKVDGGYRIIKAVRERCVFARQDITRDPPFSKLHLVVCRNLLIYLEQTLQQKVIEVFHYALRPNGFLMLGRSETIGSNADLFNLTDKRFKLYRRKPGTAVAELDFATPIVVNPVIPPARGARPGPAPERAPDGDVQGEANRLILERYGPAGVIVDSSLRIVRTLGRTSPYLELPAGDASLEIFKMARQGLLFGLRNAVTESRSKGAPVRKEGLRLSDDERTRLVNVDVTPMGADSSRHFLVLFEEGGPAATVDKKGARAKAKKSERRAGPDAVVRQLEGELEASRQYLQSIIHDLEAANEELQSANEEILSANEELQSTNEELDTAKEELQSSNEELSTLNEELQGRNEELSRANSDLLNLLASVHIPILIVSVDLKIRRFTPAAERMLNLIPTDIGRPVGHIKPNIHCPDLEVLISEVIDSITVREREVTDHEGNKYTLRIRPYKNVENRIDGAVLTLFDVSPARLHEEDLRMTRRLILLQAMDSATLVVGADWTVRQANRVFLESFGLQAPDVLGKPLFEMAEGRWDVSELRRVLEDVRVNDGALAEARVDVDLPGLGRRKMIVDVLPVASTGREQAATILVMRSITAA
jgi:two-component system CheB/CheR fusion protein